MAEADREAIRRDYEAGMSQRALALKYNYSKTAIQKMAKKGGWTVTGDRAGDHGDRVTANEPITPGEPSAPSDAYARLSALAYVLLDQVGAVIGETSAARDLRAIAATLLDVRQLLNAVSPVEGEEQKLRIEALRREMEQQTAGAAGREITVNFVNAEEAAE